MKKVKIIEGGVLDQNSMRQLKGGETKKNPCDRWFGESCNNGFINERCLIYVECPLAYRSCKSDTNFSYPCGDMGYSIKKPELFKVKF